MVQRVAQEVRQRRLQFLQNFAIHTGGLADHCKFDFFVQLARQVPNHARETLYSIARRFGVKPEDLRSWNGLKSADLTAGQRLVYRPSGTVFEAPDSSKPPASKDEAAKIALASMDAPQYYQVKTGDNLWDISTRFGRSLDDLKKLNDNLPKILRPGQKIRVR